MEEKIGFNIKLRLKWYMYLYASKFPLRNEIKFDLYTIYQTTDRLQKCVELDRPIDARPIDGKAFRSQLEIMIIIVYITVYLELCNCVILINLLVYMQNNCLLFNLYYIYITFLHLIMQCFSQKNCLYLHCINVFVVNKKSLSIKMISFLIDLFVGRI